MVESGLWTSSCLQVADGHTALSAFCAVVVPLTFSPQDGPTELSPDLVPRPAASPGNWLEMCILRPNPDLLNPQLWGWEPHPVIWAFKTSPPADFETQ